MSEPVGEIVKLSGVERPQKFKNKNCRTLTPKYSVHRIDERIDDNFFLIYNSYLDFLFVYLGKGKRT